MIHSWLYVQALSELFLWLTPLNSNYLLFYWLFSYWSIFSVLISIQMILIHMCRYFATLQKELEPYDCVLYEMVASRESLENRRNATATKRLKGSRSRGFNILGCIQRQMARVLMLDFQLDCLDYQAENWYHADLDYETFKLLQVCSFISSA